MPLILRSSVPAAGHCARKLRANIARTASALGVLKFGSAATVAVLAPGGVMATATAASAAGHPHAKVEANQAVDQEHGDRARQAPRRRDHRLLSARRKGVAGETITLDGRTGKHPRWMAIATGTTNASGSATFTVAPTVRSQFKLVFAGAFWPGEAAAVDVEETEDAWIFEVELPGAKRDDLQVQGQRYQAGYQRQDRRA
jgi:hypothetical protein